MALFLIIFLIVCVIQFLIASYSILTTRDVDLRFAYPLGSMVDAANVLEVYSKVYRQVDLRVNADILAPAYAMEEFIFVNRDKMYRTDLFTTFFTIFQLELSKKKYSFARNVIVWLKTLFFAQLAIALIGAIIEADWNIYILIIAIILASITILLSIVAYFSYDKILKRSLDVAVDLLDLDDVEAARAETLTETLAYHVFDYPIVVFARIFRFFVPFI